MSTEKNLNNLVINKVENKTVYDYMKSNNLINADELYFVTGADENATETESGLMSAVDKIKLNGISEGAEVNIQSDWNVTDTTSDAYIKNKPTTLPADGGNADTVNNHTVESNVPANAVFTDTVYTHPNYTAKTNGLYKITVDNTGHVSGTNSVSKSDITALGIPAQDTTYSEATTTSAGLMSASDKSRLDGLVATGGEANQNAFSNVVIGDKIITAENETDTFTIIAGNNITLTPDEANNRVTISAKDTTYSAAGASLGLVKTGGDATITDGIITIAELDSKVEKVDGKGLSTNDYTTEEKNKLAGLDSTNYVAKSGDTMTGKLTAPQIETGSGDTNYFQSRKFRGEGDASTYYHAIDFGYANHDQVDFYEYGGLWNFYKNTSSTKGGTLCGKISSNGWEGSAKLTGTPTAPTATSGTNTTQIATTAFVQTAIGNKVDKVTGKQLSSNDYTTAEKEKLAGIEEGANKTIVDTALSSTSTNPVQNKVINTKFNSVQSDIDSKVPSTRTVNGKALSANITLSASDVGALPSTTQIPSIDGLATETYVDNKVAGLVDSAPATLDTLNELAAALGDDPNFATTVATQIGTKVDKVDGKGLSTNDYTTTEKTKLSGIAEGAEVNQNAFSNIVVGSTTVAADSKTDTLTLVAGTNVTLTPDATNDKITIASKDTVYTHPSYTARTGVPTANQTPAFGGTFNVSQPVSDATGHITAINSRTITIPSAVATTSTAGLMSASDKSKLDGLQDALDSKVDVAYGQYAITTAGDGAAYTATVPGITALTAGASFIMIPHTVSTTTSPTLNVNGLGAKYIRRRLTSMATSAQNGYTTSWLASGVPFRVIYDGTQWIVEGHDKPAAADLYGAAPKATADANGNNIVNTYLNKTGDTMTGALCFTEGVGFGTGTPASTITNPVEGQLYLQIISE